MKLLPSKLSLALLSTALLFAAGCAKKPIRPDPSATVIGPNTGGGPIGGGTGSDLGAATDLGTQLVDRGPGVIETDDKIIGLLKPVFFDFNESGVKASERPKLAAAKEYLAKNPQYRLLLEGHCDWRGTDEYNLGLGDRRANQSKKYLATLGVAAAKLETLSKGDQEAKEGATAEEMTKDRRVELVILKK